MAELFDKDGKPVEGAMTKEEIDAAVAAAGTKAVDDFKAANPPKEEKKEEVKDEVQKQIEQLSSLVQGLVTTNNESVKASFASKFAGGNADDAAKFNTMYDRLTGFEETPDGRAERAEAAARAAGLSTEGIDVGDFAGTGGGKNIDPAKTVASTSADKLLQPMFGLTPEDVTKFTPKEGTNN